MSEPFLAEIRLVGFNFAPRGWAFCDGQKLPINQNQSLYSLLGTAYGGDGITSFALPDIRGRTPIHVGSSNGTTHLEGQKSGEEKHTLSAAEMPQHSHGYNATTASANTFLPKDAYLAKAPANLDTYAEPTNLSSMNPSAISNTGGSQAHENMQPFLTVNFCIALQGLFPSRN